MDNNCINKQPLRIKKEINIGNVVLNGAGQCKVKIYSNDDSTIPCFYITNNKRFKCCIVIYEAIYVSDKSRSELTNTEAN